MSKARTLANLISDNAELADGQISVAEVVGAAPTASPTFTGTVNADAITMSGFLTVNGGADFNTVLYPDGISMADSRTISFGTSADFELNGGSTFLDFNLKDNARHLRIKNGLVEHHRFSGDGSVIFNESGADANFRVESDSNSHMLFVDGGTNKVGVGITPTETFHVNGRSRLNNLYVGEIYASLDLIQATSSNGLYLIGGASNLTLGAESIFNTNGADVDFRVESDSNTHALFVEAGTNTVGILQPNPNNWSNSANQLVIGTTSGSNGLTVVSGTGNSGNLFFSDGTTGNQQYRGYIQYDHTNDRLNLGSGAADHVRVEGSQTVVNEDSNDHDFRVESNNNANMLFVNADQDKVGVGTGGPDSVMHVFGDFKATYYRPLNATNQTSSYHLNFWKLGRIYLVGADAGEIVLQGAKHGYGSGANIVGKTTILLRGGTSATALDGIFYSEGQTSATSPPDVRYVSVGNNSFDIYVKHSAYSSLTHTVTTGGSWTPSLTNTGSTSNPANSVGIPTERSFWLGDREVLRQTQTETVINETSNDHDFRVESNNNANMLFVDAGNDRVGIGLSNPSYPLEVAGQTKVGFDNDSTSLIGTGYNGAFLHNGLNVPANTTTYTPHFEGTARVSGAGYVSHMTVGTKRDGTSSWNNCGFIAYGGNDAGPTQLWEFTVNGQFNSPSTKNFKIKHPLAELNETHDLYHAAIEGPNADLIYRGVVTLVAGSATVNIDTVSRMTEGTFVALTKDIQSFTSNETDWTPVRGSVSGNILTVEAQDNTSTASVSWMVVAKRNDFNVIDNETTDENGEFITERIQ